MLSRMSVLGIAMLLCAAVEAAAAPLTVAQLLRLISIGTPDRIVAAEVSDRGIRDQLTPRTIETIRKGGAGPATLAAIDKLRPRATLVVKAPARTVVTIGGTRLGTVEESGLLTLKDLWPGNQEVVAELYDHTPATQAVMLAAGKSVTIELRPVSVYASLSIDADVPGATVEIEGLSSARAPVKDMRVRPGSYTVTVRAPYRKPQVETVEVQAGASINRSIALQPDTGALQQLLERIQRGVAQDNHRAVRDDVKAYLAAVPAENVNGRQIALASAFSSQLALRAFAEAVGAGREALEIGATLVVELVHHHGAGFVRPHAARLAFSRTQLSYDPLDTCNFRQGMVDITQTEVALQQNARLSALGLPRRTGASALQLKIPKPEERGEYFVLNFLAEEEVLSATTVLLEAAKQRSLASTYGSSIDPLSVPGRYVKVGNAADYLELNADGTFQLREANQPATGTYLRDGLSLTLQVGRRTFFARFEDGRIIDRQGQTWEKTKRSQ